MQARTEEPQVTNSLLLIHISSCGDLVSSGPAGPGLRLVLRSINRHVHAEPFLYFSGVSVRKCYNLSDLPWPAGITPGWESLYMVGACVESAVELLDRSIKTTFHKKISHSVFYCSAETAPSASCTVTSLLDHR